MLSGEKHLGHSQLVALEERGGDREGQVTGDGRTARVSAAASALCSADAGLASLSTCMLSVSIQVRRCRRFTLLRARHTSRSLLSLFTRRRCRCKSPCSCPCRAGCTETRPAAVFGVRRGTISPPTCNRFCRWRAQTPPPSLSTVKNQGVTLIEVKVADHAANIYVLPARR